MTEEEVIELLSNAYVKFNYYYKYTFYFTGEVPGTDIKIVCSYGGDSHDIYRFEVNTDSIKFSSIGDWTTVAIFKGNKVVFHKDNSW